MASRQQLPLHEDKIAYIFDDVLKKVFQGDVAAFEHHAADFLARYEGTASPEQEYIMPAMLKEATVADKMKAAFGRKRETITEVKTVIKFKVLEGRNLMSKDATGYSDPFCKLFVRRDKYDTSKVKVQGRTKTRPQTLNPVWNEDFTINGTMVDEELVVDVFDQDKFTADEPMGRAVLSISTITKTPTYSWLNLVDTSEAKNMMGSILVRAHLITKGADDLRVETDPAQEERMIKELGQVAKLSVFVTTWNIGNTAPPDDLSSWLTVGHHDIYAIGAQECQYTPRNDYKSCTEDWLACLLRHFGSSYSLIRYHSLREIRLAVFAYHKHLPYITDVWHAEEATGIGNVVGNKGAVVVGLSIHSTRLGFLNTHLAAHQDRTAARNQNVRDIFRGIKRRCGDRTGDLRTEFHHLFFAGDLNYRLDLLGNKRKVTAENFYSIYKQINANELGALLQKDQLLTEKAKERVLYGFEEGRITFRPTFKVLRGKQLAFVSQRAPAWCDRTLWTSIPGYSIKQTAYYSTEDMTSSDHKPVVAAFALDAYILPPALDHTKGKCTMTITKLAGESLQLVALREGEVSSVPNNPELVLSGAPLIRKLQSCKPTKVVKDVYHAQALREIGHEALLDVKDAVHVARRKSTHDGGTPSHSYSQGSGEHRDISPARDTEGKPAVNCVWEEDLSSTLQYNCEERIIREELYVQCFDSSKHLVGTGVVNIGKALKGCRIYLTLDGLFAGFIRLHIKLEWARVGAWKTKSMGHTTLKGKLEEKYKGLGVSSDAIAEEGGKEGEEGGEDEPEETQKEEVKEIVSASVKDDKEDKEDEDDEVPEESKSKIPRKPTREDDNDDNGHFSLF